MIYISGFSVFYFRQLPLISEVKVIEILEVHHIYPAETGFDTAVGSVQMP